MTVSQVLLGYLRQHALDRIASARYQSDGAWYAAQITKKEILSNGQAAVYFSIAHEQSGPETVTAVQLLDSSDALLAEDETDVERASGAEALYYQARLKIVTEQEDES